MADRSLFVTGKLAAPALRATLRRAELPFEYDLAVMKITVAALMTPDWIARRLEVPPGVTRIMIPGLCPGDPAVLSERFEVPAEKGPADLKRLPAFFGQADARSPYGARAIRIFAEINSVRHPDVEMFMGIANLTELTEADTTGVTALLLGFCQELGIRNVLTTEVIDWARGAVREAVLAAKLMYFAQQEGTPPKHVDGRLLTIKDEEVRPYTEAELRELQASITDPNIRIFADGEWIYAFNADLFVKGTDINQIFDELGIDEHTHAFYLGKELMKAAIARGLGKNYRQESPLDWGYLTFDEPRRERVRLTARLRGSSDEEAS